MPPKNKKDAEEEAKRLQQQKRKKQEQQARLEIERKKYLAETLPTGLLLPVSVPLLQQFPHKPLDFVSQKLKQAIKQTYPDVVTSSRLDFILKQLHYFIKDSFQIFGQVKQGHNANKHRIFIGIMLATLLNDHGKGKNRGADERKIKELATQHCQKTEGVQSLSKADGLAILNYAKMNYFAKFLLIENFDKFKKRQAQTRLPIYIETPNVYYNEQTTPWTDLSNHEQKKEERKAS